MPDGATATMLPQMRHFAARSGGTYVLRFPGRPLPKRFAMSVRNAFRTTDSFVFAVTFDPAINAAGYLFGGSPGTNYNILDWMDAPSGEFTRRFSPAGSLTEVTSSAGDKIWQDRANGLVWIKVQGGLLPRPLEPATPNSDADLYRTHSVVLHQAK